MANVVRFEVSGMTSAKYHDVLRRLEAAGQGAPAGRLQHYAFGDPENLQVIDVWEDPASFERFGQTLVPILTEMSIQAKPDFSPIHNQIAG